MDDKQEKFRLPPSLEVVQHAGGLQQFERYKTEDSIITFLWREEAGVKVTYLHVSDEPTLHMVPEGKVGDAIDHPMFYAGTTGFPFEDILEIPKVA